MDGQICERMVHFTVERVPIKPTATASSRRMTTTDPIVFVVVLLLDDSNHEALTASSITATRPRHPRE